MPKKMLLALIMALVLVVTVLHLRANSQRFSAIDHTVAGIERFSKAAPLHWRTHPELAKQADATAVALSAGLFLPNWVQNDQLGHPLGGSVTVAYTRSPQYLRYVINLADIMQDDCILLVQRLSVRLPQLVPPQIFLVNGTAVRQKFNAAVQAKPVCAENNQISVILTY